MTQAGASLADRRLLAAIQDFVIRHPGRDVGRFAECVANWGDAWTPIAPNHLPAADRLSDCLALTSPGTQTLTAAFAAEASSRHWEQGYTQADNLVGEDMLAGYGFAEVIGKRGPFLSDRVRAGIGVWGRRSSTRPIGTKPKRFM